MSIKKWKLDKRKIFTLSIVVAVFIMSLGYAALSQHMDIDGIASIDRSWIVKITNMVCTSSGTAAVESSSYVSNTAVINANIGDSSSSLTCTITLENQGNIKAKLGNIDAIEDENTNITYSISGVTEDVTTLNPGETNTATVKIQYQSGVTNASDTSKSIMLTFNYIENQTTSTTTPSTPTEIVQAPGTYMVGDKVTLVDGSIWYVTKQSLADEEYITLVSDAFVNPTTGALYANNVEVRESEYSMVFDGDRIAQYEPTKSNNIGYFIDNTFLPILKSSIEKNGGNANGTTARLLTIEEANKLYEISSIIAGRMYGTWLLDNGDLGDTTACGCSSYVCQSELADEYATFGAKPVIITLKENIITTLATQIKTDNVIQDASVINSTLTNYTGLFVTSTNTQDGQPTYFFRGDVTNNYVYFAGMYWQVVRINEDGSVRLIYRGTTPTATGSAATIGSSAFNSSYSDNAYIGYMYGTTGSTNYTATHKNTNGSTIKTFIDSWYEANLASYADYLGDTGFCNDRSLYNGVGYGTNRTYYGAYHRFEIDKTFQFACPQQNDLFTVSNSKGNTALTYPIGLITIDEAAYAGAVYDTWNTNYYLYVGADYWTMSPNGFDISSNTASAAGAYMNGSLSYGIKTSNSYGVRPVINLKFSTKAISGTGTAGDPYVVEEGVTPPITDTGGPTMTITTQSSTTYATSRSVTISVVDDTGLATDNSYQYYLSTSSSSLSGGSWTTYTKGSSFTIGTGKTGVYYLYVKQTYDTLGNVSTATGASKITTGGETYHRWGPYYFDNSIPTVSVSVTGNSSYVQTQTLTISVSDSGSGLYSANSYQYYLSTSSTALSGGEWITYTPGSSISIGSGYTGTYYLFVKRVRDVAGNYSTSNGTNTTISGTIYHRYGTYMFDNTPPVISVSSFTAFANGYDGGLKYIASITDEHSGVATVARIFNSSTTEYSSASDFLSIRGKSSTGGTITSTWTYNTTVSGASLPQYNLCYYVYIAAKDAVGNVSTLYRSTNCLYPCSSTGTSAGNATYCPGGTKS